MKRTILLALLLCGGCRKQPDDAVMPLGTNDAIGFGVPMTATNHVVSNVVYWDGAYNPSFGRDPAVGGKGWYSDKPQMLLQDEHGQVYKLYQSRTNSNLYVVWEMMGETNGITNSFSWQWRQKYGDAVNVFSNCYFVPATVTNSAPPGVMP